jgi:hypothetical protein
MVFMLRMVGIWDMDIKATLADLKQFSTPSIARGTNAS